MTAVRELEPVTASNGHLPPVRGLHWKYRMRLAVIPALAKLGRAVGLSWPMLGRRLGREVLLAQSGAIDRGPSDELAEQKLDIVFFTMMGGHHHNVSVDVVLGLALLARGHRVRFVVCDQQLPICEVKRAGQEDHWERSCAKCWAFGQRYLSGFGFDIMPLSELVGDQHADDGDWSQFVEASLLKHYRVGLLDESDEVQGRREMFRQSAQTSASAARKVIAMQPDRVIMSHGIYTTWGPALHLFNEAGIPVVTYGKGKRRATEKFNWNRSSDWWDVADEWERVKETPLTRQQDEQLNEYLQSRRSHARDTLVYNFGEEESIEQTRRRLRLDPDQLTYVLFTNVLWDAASTQREIVFDNPIDWVLQTITWFADHPGRQLVVKIHPAEEVIGTNQPFAEIIRGQFPEFPANVRLIEPHEKVNSWSIMRIADLGLVHTSTVGMELPLEGIPCAVVSDTHFRGKGFTIDVSTREEYSQLLNDPPSSHAYSATQIVYARRYAYLLFERYQLPWDYFYEVAHTDVRAFAFASATELTREDGIKLFVDAFENNQEFVRVSS